MCVCMYVCMCVHVCLCVCMYVGMYTDSQHMEIKSLLSSKIIYTLHEVEYQFYES
jgi:hypothetical protein